MIASPFQDVVITLVLGAFFLVAGVIASVFAPEWDSLDSSVYDSLIAAAVSFLHVHVADCVTRFTTLLIPGFLNRCSVLWQ